MSAAQVTTPTRFFAIIPRDILDRLVPKQSEAFGLYAQLADAVTCVVPNGDKKFGLVLGGTSMSQPEWAKRFRTTERSFHRVLGILKEEGLIVVHGGNRGTRIALTDSVKKSKRRETLDRHYWLLELFSSAKYGGSPGKYGGAGGKYGGAGIDRNG